MGDLAIILTALVVLVGAGVVATVAIYWIDHRERRQRDEDWSLTEHHLEDDESEDLRASIRKSKASGFRR